MACVIIQDTIHGKCKVKYILGAERGNQTVRKFTDQKSCEAWNQENWSNMMPFYCTANMQVTYTRRAFYSLIPVVRKGKRAHNKYRTTTVRVQTHTPR